MNWRFNKFFVRAPNGSGYPLQVLVPQNTGGTAGFPLLSLTRAAIKAVSLCFRFFLLLIFAAGCKERYRPNIVTPDTGYLVVEGIVSKGPDSTYIELSRTNKLGTIGKQYEGGATLQLEGEDNSIAPLSELPAFAGRYGAKFSLNDHIKYRLRIKTQNGKEYLSDLTEVKTTPPIDSISWQRDDAGVQLYINTHDPQNNSHYYLWDYVETWEFHSAFRSFLTFVVTTNTDGTKNVDIAFKDPVSTQQDTSIYKCWRSTASNQLIIGSSAKLTEDVIYKPLLLIPAADRKISVMYSMLLRQHAITKPGYEFLEKMKKNTEENGSIFDAQPSQLKGNIYCITDPAEPVIGYLNISTAVEKRLFISNDQVPNWRYFTECEETKVLNMGDSIMEAYRSGALPTDALELRGNAIVYFGVTTPPCVDCTITGTNVKPAFWPR